LHRFVLLLRSQQEKNKLAHREIIVRISVKTVYDDAVALANPLQAQAKQREINSCNRHYRSFVKRKKKYYKKNNPNRKAWHCGSLTLKKRCLQ